MPPVPISKEKQEDTLTKNLKKNIDRKKKHKIQPFYLDPKAFNIHVTH